MQRAHQRDRHSDGSKQKDGQQSNKKTQGGVWRKGVGAYVDGRQVGSGCAVIEDLDASY